MKKIIYWLAIFLTIGLFAGSTAGAAQGQGEARTKASSKQKKATPQPSRVLGVVEELSGTIQSVDVAASKVTVTSAGVPYVFLLTKKTKIEINGEKGDLEALSKAVDQKASVRFVPRSNGNSADHVEVKSS
ncbi:MAG TPA: hypothetical protein VFN26_15275 [Candidatus Acidoferrum sp.]|nr:hypothetical protein [Candidatus Acidoferrum sp.]